MSSQKCSIISIIGAPNAGKSTLLNELISYKLSITSPKVQTTRVSVKGIYTQGNSQLIFFDTPGIFEAKTKFEQALVKAAWNKLIGVDFIMLIIDVKRGVSEETQNIIEELKKRNLKALLILNKIDLQKSKIVEELSQQLNTHNIFIKTFLISALNKNGVEDLKEYLLEHAKIQEWIYSEEDITDLPTRFLTTELTREQLFYHLNQELPYNVTVDVEKWEELNNGDLKIHQVIQVSKESQKMIIIGKGGQLIKEVGQKARLEIEKLLERKVHLFLFVKVKPDWTESPDFYNNPFR